MNALQTLIDFAKEFPPELDLGIPGETAELGRLAAAELAGKDARIAELEQGIKDVNEWLVRDGLEGTGHQRLLERLLKAK